jgi:hypothetical protein
MQGDLEQGAENEIWMLGKDSDGKSEKASINESM